jgi:uncharacterized protein Yka (UPF0111/DUF47 family)
MKLKKKLTAIETTLGELAALVPKAAEGYLAVLQAPKSERAAESEKVSALEAEADDRHLALVRDVGNTFITPYDREDLFGLLEDLDDIIDDIDLASRTCAALPVDALADEVINSGRDVHQMAELMSGAVSLIKDPEELVKTLVQANEHYASIRANYVAYLARLLSDESSAIEAVRGKLLVDQIETIAGEMESFGRSLGVMAIKET